MMGPGIFIILLFWLVFISWPAIGTLVLLSLALLTPMWPYFVGMVFLGLVKGFVNSRGN